MINEARKQSFESRILTIQGLFHFFRGLLETEKLFEIKKIQVTSNQGCKFEIYFFVLLGDFLNYPMTRILFLIFAQLGMDNYSELFALSILYYQRGWLSIVGKVSVQTECQFFATHANTMRVLLLRTDSNKLTVHERNDKGKYFSFIIF